MDTPSVWSSCLLAGFLPDSMHRHVGPQVRHQIQHVLSPGTPRHRSPTCGGTVMHRMRWSNHCRLPKGQRLPPAILATSLASPADQLRETYCLCLVGDVAAPLLGDQGEWQTMRKRCVHCVVFGCVQSWGSVQLSDYRPQTLGRVFTATAWRAEGGGTWAGPTHRGVNALSTFIMPREPWVILHHLPLV